MTNTNSILIPICGQVALTIIVWWCLLITRIGEIRRKRIRPQELADGVRANELLKNVEPVSENFENLFEVPILFYVAAFIILITKTSDDFYFYCASLFVLLRTIHSFIHCTYNKVMHRFYVYIFSTMVLWTLWVRLFVQTVQLLKN